MNKPILIVESPTKAKTIGNFLGDKFIVRSCYGHVRDLPADRLGVDINENFKAQYVILPRVKKIIKELKHLEENIEEFYLATDYDREGEAIAWHLVETVGVNKKKVRRITFHEITKEAILGALKKARPLDQNLIHSQQARRILDRLVGYKLSPLLWKKVGSGLSAGRVQSVAVRLIVDREREIKSFKPEEYWTIKAKLTPKDKEHLFFASLIRKGKKKYGKFDIKNQTMAHHILDDVANSDFVVKEIVKSERKRTPSPPFTTSTLQQEASHKLGFLAKDTMKIAQDLYEGIDLGPHGNPGLITYMRTDSVTVAKSAQDEAISYIRKTFGKEYIPQQKRRYKTPTIRAQEAHEAIRPTSVFRVPEKIKTYLTPKQFKLYNLIWQRFLASQMSDAIFDTVSVDIEARSYIFRATGQNIKFHGFMKIYVETVENEEEKDYGKNLEIPVLSKGEELKLINLIPEQHFTEPPPRYNEASLIRTLEKFGIGRPSTYAPIISTIKNRNYVRLKNRKFYPQEVGVVVNDLLVKHFPTIVDNGFTALMEKGLDDIAQGEVNYVKVLNNFYNTFERDLKQAYQNMKKVKSQPTNKNCPNCGAKLEIKMGRYGRFLACTAFPKCRYTHPLEESSELVKGEKCPKCGRNMIIRVSRRGKFLACSGYPACRVTKNLPKQEGQ